MTNVYSDNKTPPQRGDYVHGTGPLGHPLAGTVEDIDRVNGKVRIAPQVHADLWASTNSCTKVTGAQKV